MHDLAVAHDDRDGAREITGCHCGIDPGSDLGEAIGIEAEGGRIGGG